MDVDASFVSFHACAVVKYQSVAVRFNQKLLYILVTSHHHIIRIIHHIINHIQPDIQAVQIQAVDQTIHII